MPTAASRRGGVAQLVATPETGFALIVACLALSGLALWLLPVQAPALRIVAIALNGAIVVSCALAVSALLGNGIAERAWPRILAALTLLVGWIVVAVKLGASTFAIDDEIYSWNMWSIQHALGESADFSYTMAPYPQLLPYWLGSLYRAADDLRNQGFVRLFLSVSFLLYFGTLLAAAQRGSRVVQWIGLVVAIVAFKSLKIEKWFSIGLADALMAATLLCSVACVLRFHANPARLPWLAAAVIAAAAAAFIKQPALLWGIASLPAITIFFVLRRQWPPMALALVAVGAAICVMWPLTEGAGFQHNSGVIHRSMADRSPGMQLLFAAKTIFSRQPLLLVLALASAALAWRTTITRALWLALILPTTVLWLMFGSYDVRLGLHAIGLMLLTLLYALATPHAAQREDTSLHAPVLQTAAILAIAVALIAIGIAKRDGGMAAFSDGVAATIDEHYGSDAPRVIEEFLDKRTPLFATSNYVYGILYGHSPVIRPHYVESYGRKQLIEDLRSSGANHAVETGRFAFGPASDLLRELAAACPDAFVPIARSIPHYGFTFYRIDYARLTPDCVTPTP